MERKDFGGGGKNQQKIPFSPLPITVVSICSWTPRNPDQHTKWLRLLGVLVKECLGIQAWEPIWMFLTVARISLANIWKSNNYQDNKTG